MRRYCRDRAMDGLSAEPARTIETADVSESSQEPAPTALGFFVLDDEGAFAIAWPALPLKRFDIITQQVA